MNIIQRYAWSDAIVEAQAMGVIGNGEFTTAMKLAHAIYWEPSDGRPSGLYWSNELAAQTVGLGLATFYRRIKSLKQAGFFEEVKGNLIPCIPDSQSETHAKFDERKEALKAAHTSQSESQPLKVRVATSQSESPNSQSDKTYSGDYAVERYSGDLYSEDSIAGAKAPALPAEGGESSTPTSSDDLLIPDSLIEPKVHTDIYIDNKTRLEDSSDSETSFLLFIGDYPDSQSESCSLEDKKYYFDGWLAAGKPCTLEKWVEDNKKQFNW